MLVMGLNTPGRSGSAAAAWWTLLALTAALAGQLQARGLKEVVLLNSSNATLTLQHTSRGAGLEGGRGPTATAAVAEAAAIADAATATAVATVAVAAPGGTATAAAAAMPAPTSQAQQAGLEAATMLAATHITAVAAPAEPAAAGLLLGNNSVNPAGPVQELTGTPLWFTPAAAAAMQAAFEQQHQLHLEQLQAAAATAGGSSRAQPGAVPPLFQAILERHNGYRSKHQVPALSWDNLLSAQAATYAAQCVFGHDPNSFTGESLYASSDVSNPAFSLADAIDMWYKEVQVYDFNEPRFSAATGRFTQVVWRASTRLGCAVQTCSDGIVNAPFAAGALVVCRYTPAGNVIGQFATNVLPVVGPPAPPTASPPNGQLPPGTLLAGYKFVSPGCLMAANSSAWMCMQADGDVVLFHNKQPVWTSNTAGRSAFRPFKLTLQRDGLLVASDNLNQNVWASDGTVKGSGPFKLVVHDVGIAAVYNSEQEAVWATNTGLQ